MAQTPERHNGFVLEQPKIDAYRRVDGLQQVFIVLFRVVNVATDGVAGHLGGRKWYKQVF
jgi:hypothetical protein